MNAAPVTARARERVRLRLWLPLTPLLFLVLAPLGLIALPLVALVCLAWGVNPLTLYWATGRLLLAVAGTHVEVDSPDALIRIRIF